jgi:plastocyanin
LLAFPRSSSGSGFADSPPVEGAIRMSKRGFLGAAAIVLLATACSSDPPSGPSGGGGGGGTPANVTVRIPLTDYGGNQTPQFQPVNATIPVGGTVAWSNQDSTGHTTTSETNIWNGNLSPGGSFQRTFPTAGQFPYVCTVHPGMSGTVIVQ